jgi:phosphohistidine phosphatase
VPLMAEMLEASGLSFQFILSSTAARAVETANLLIQATGFAGPLELTPRLYLAEPSAFVEALADLPVGTGTTVAVGHNPGISELALLLTGQEVDMSTASVAQIELPIAEFSDLDLNTRGQLVAFLRPPRDDKERLRDGKDRKRKGKQRSP